MISTTVLAQVTHWDALPLAVLEPEQAQLLLSLGAVLVGVQTVSITSLTLIPLTLSLALLPHLDTLPITLLLEVDQPETVHSCQSDHHKQLPCLVLQFSASLISFLSDHVALIIGTCSIACVMPGNTILTSTLLLTILTETPATNGTRHEPGHGSVL